MTDSKQAIVCGISVEKFNTLGIIQMLMRVLDEIKMYSAQCKEMCLKSAWKFCEGHVGDDIFLYCARVASRLACYVM